MSVTGRWENMKSRVAACVRPVQHSESLNSSERKLLHSYFWRGTGLGGSLAMGLEYPSGQRV
jgi:hypothetical protein